ncbi:universal stress protein [Mucilaginibacter aquariorum]|uniref:Universal stress protein n=1 Tax=Mucilaginibacter aquariorum TaxID=2967225 RepID=A0ABT1T450_9SPHI|nr:universal stress protein [Mucilaginibacter aquariorum]MCQ6959195.1 universal stress protein [Mucilaginibacter aquariorum]
MKTILVPTDFSPAAFNAAKYALHLAGKVKAGIKLCTALKVPAESVLAAQVAWPLEDFDSLKKNAEKEFEILTKQLLKGLKGAPGQPQITKNIGVGELTDYVRNMVAEHRISLVVMGMSGAGALSRFFLGSNSKEMIARADFPLMLVPENVKYVPIKKIAFATDLSPGDIDIIHALSGWARVYNAEILISHVTDYDDEYIGDRTKIDNFLNDVSGKVDYPNIYYRDIESRSVNRGLTWLAEEGQSDLLVMVHRGKTFLNDLFNPSHTQRLAKDINLPLLVFPSHYDQAFL